MAIILPNAKIAPPIPEDFDFQPFLIVPPALDPKNWPLGARNIHNCSAEIHNQDSMVLTLKCSGDRINFPDVGPPLQSLFPYSADEITILATSDELCTKVGPLPTFLLIEVERTRLLKVKRPSTTGSSSKDTLKATPVAGSMLNSNPVIRVAGQQPKSVISDIYLYSIRQKLFLPLHWFSNHNLQVVQHHLHDLHTKVVRVEPTSEGSSLDLKVLVFDALKMTTLWGSDKHHSCLSPIKWLECMKNYHAALVILSPATDIPIEDVVPTSASFADEFLKHFRFFTAYPDFESTFPIWYAFERLARNDILQGTLFDRQYYVQKVAILLQVREEVNLLTHFISPPPPNTKRPSDSDLYGTYKVPRTTSNDSLRSFRNPDDSQHSFRNSELSNRTARNPDTSGANRSSAPTCIICAAPHLLRAHPSNITLFTDGKPCFSTYRDSELWTLKPQGSSKDLKRICVEFNLAPGCKRQHEDGRLHVCSLCGREHSALSRLPSCVRVIDGVIRA